MRHSKGNGFYFFLFLLLLLSSVVHAQHALLKGVVRDVITKEVIPGANIYSAKDHSLATVSDDNGNYQLTLTPGRHTILCSFIGMKVESADIEAKAAETVVYQFTLSPESRMLNTVVVSAGKFEQKIEDITVSMEVIKASLIESKNASNIKGALEQVPGLTILDGEPQIRAGSGFSFGVGSHVAVLVDGIPVMLGDQGRPEWSFIPTENTEQVEVIKGASSVLFGSSALSGVINIRTAFPKAVPVTKIRIDYGQYDKPRGAGTKWWSGAAPFYGYSFLHSQQLLKNRNLDFVIGGFSRYDHNYIGPPGAQKNILFSYDTTTTENEVASLLTRVNFSLRNRSQKITGLAFGLAGNFMQSHDNFSLVWLNDSSGIYQAYPNTMTVYDMKIFYVDPFIEYYSTGGIRHSLRTRIFYHDSDDNMHQGTESTSHFGEYQVSKELTTLGGLHFTGGIAANKINAKAELYASSGREVNTLENYAAFTQFDKKFKNILNISLGFRGEYYAINQSESVLKPVFRSGLSLALSKGTFLRMSYGQAYRYPTITEKYISTVEGGIYILPNPDLKPETSQSSEAGVRQGFKIGNFLGFFDAAAFWQDYENTIEFNYAIWDTTLEGTSVAGFKRVNTGSTRVRGIDLSLGGEGNLLSGLSLTIIAGYTYSLPEAIEPEYVYAVENPKYYLQPKKLTYLNTSSDTADYILKYRFEHLAKADAELSWKWISVGGGFRYYSYMKNIDKTFYDLDKPYGLQTGITQYRERNKKGIWLYDTRIRIKFNSVFSASLIVNNAANKRYSLRPLKIESPRTFAVQVMAKF